MSGIDKKSEVFDTMKLRILGLLLLLGVSLLLGGRTGPALAQSENETVSLKNFDLYLNPEYDDPRLLVMMEGDMVGAAPPVRISFLVPTGAEMYSAGSLTGRNGQGYTGGPPERQPASIEGWDEVSYDLTTKIFRVEYYDANIAGDPDKTISYDFNTVYPISNLRVIVQQPKGATGFSSSLNMPGSDPKTGVKGIDGQGFTIYSYNLNNIEPGKPVHFDISYTKAGTGTSVTPTTPASSPVSHSRTSNSSW